MQRANLALGTIGMVAVLALTGCGKTAVRGTVLDEQQQPVRGASIATEPPTDLLITDQLGNFAIERVLDENSQPQAINPGAYQLTIKKLGYEDKIIPLKIGERQDLPLGKIVLARKKIDMSEVGDVEGSMPKGPTGDDLSYGPYRGE